MSLKAIQKKMPKIFTRNRVPNLSYLSWRKSLFDHYSEKYEFFETYEQYQALYSTINTYGRTGYLLRTIDESFGNANVVMAAIDKFQPKAIVLGGLNHHDIDFFTDGNAEFNKIPLIYNKYEQLLAKERMTKYFVKTMPLSNRHFKSPKIQLIFQPNTDTQTLTFSDNLSAAYSSCLSLNNKLIFGKPDMSLFLEDIVLRISVDELRSIFFDVMKSVIEEVKNDEKIMCLHDVDTIYKYIYNMTKKNYGKRIYNKWIVYNASLLRMSLRLFGDTASLIDYYLANEMLSMGKEPILPEFDQIFRTYLDSNDSFYTTQEKKLSSLKTMGKNLNDMIKNDKERIKIKKMLDESDLEFNYRKKEMPIFENLYRMDAETIIEKYVILSHIVTYDFKEYFASGTNPLEVTIFKDIIAKKFPNCESVFQKFNEINEKYKPALHKTQNYFIQRVKDHKSGGRTFYKSMKDQEEIMANRMTKGELDFTVGFLNRLKLQALVSKLLHTQIEKIIKRKMAQGIPQTDTLLNLKNLSKGIYTKENLEMFLYLIAEANAELKLIKLPAYYKSTFPGIKEKVVSELEGSFKKMLDFIKTERTVSIKDPNSEEIQNFKTVLMNQNFPLENLEKLFLKKSSNKNNQDPDDIDYNKHVTEFMNKEEKKMYTFAYGPEGVPNPELPADLDSKSPEEMEAMGFIPVDQIELEITSQGEIVGGDLTEEKREKINKIFKDLNKKK